MTVLELNGLCKYIKDNLIYKDIFFKVEKGECFAIIGKDYEGKTSIIEAVLGLKAQDEGEVIYFEGNMGKKEALGHIGYVPDDLLGFRGMTGLKLLDMMIGMKKLQNMVEWAEELIDFFEVNPAIRLDAMEDDMNKRMYIINALLSKPDILILDEPFNFLTEEGAGKLKSFIEIYKASGRSVIIVSDNYSDVSDICDRFTAMSGRTQLIEEGFPGNYTPRVLVRAKEPDIEYLKHMLITWCKADENSKTFIRSLNIRRYNESFVDFVMQDDGMSVKKFLLALRCESFVTKALTAEEQIFGEGA